ncbi:MAG: DNA mismatch repair endonuclease MutL [Lachnospiraceae bacterium]|nr:DNA mismatch repair endonuclease MutL [Lachnospiraceae bacterium]
MMNIKILDNQTINKIAAGEVIENASSVVKELVENSIDANARKIQIEVRNGGIDYIKVSDDGEGIEKEDILDAFKEHATSKLSSIKDLESITSFGFRGEALPSIAAISDVSVITKSVKSIDSYGYSCDVLDNKSGEIKEVASNTGTTIIVRNLFKNVPVRKKFLKDYAKENSYIVDLVMKTALANPHISFSIKVDGRDRFLTKGDGDQKAILYSIYGKDVYDNLIEIDKSFDDIVIKGLIAKPAITRSTRQDEIYFVNHRYVKNKTISNAVENAFSAYLMQHKYPLCVLNIDIDGKNVDVNVHPRKLEVRFTSEERVYYVVFNAIDEALKKSILIPEEHIDYDVEASIEEADAEKDKESSDISAGPKDFDALPSLGDILDKKVESSIPIGNIYKRFDEIEFLKKRSLKVHDSKTHEESFITKTLTDNHKYIGQVFDTYILVEYEEKLYIIDQHAAHEKINFEKLMRQFNEGKVDSQKIFPSIVLKLTPLQYSAVENNIEEFAKVGYEIERFGDNDIKVDAVPYNIFNIGSKELLMDMIESFADDKNAEVYSSIAEKIASISCKKSIKAGHKLSELEVKELLRELFKLDNPYNCPHGRPTIISLSKAEFEKKFGRVI